MIRSVTLNNFFLLTLFLVISCGREVNISNSKLKNYSGLNENENVQLNQEGILIRGTPDTISSLGRSHQVSSYSSIQALEFIASKPLGTQMPVRFRQKEIRNNEIILELIQAK